MSVCSLLSLSSWELSDVLKGWLLLCGDTVAKGIYTFSLLLSSNVAAQGKAVSPLSCHLFFWPSIMLETCSEIRLNIFEFICTPTIPDLGGD